MGKVHIEIHSPPSGGSSAINRTLPPREPPMAIMVSQVDQDYIDAMYRRSIELAYARGHIRR